MRTQTSSFPPVWRVSKWMVEPSTSLKAITPSTSAAVYAFRPTLAPFLTLTGDQRDLDLVAGLSPAPNSMLAVELSFGNGFLDRLEHRQQYKLNAQRLYTLGAHRLTIFGIAYFGVSYIPGLIPLLPPNAGDPAVVNYGDTLDPRQHDQTHTTLTAASDTWNLTPAQQLRLSAFFRTYNLSLFSNFGQGLIRQSEFRTVAGQSSNYTNKLAESFTLLAGLDYNREAPRRDNLDHYSSPYVPGALTLGPFTKVDSANITLTSYTPYAAAAGSITPYLRYYAGWRRDQIEVASQDLINPANSFSQWVGLNSPKATISFLPDKLKLLPQVSASFGQAFFTEDPRIGAGASQGSPIATAHSYQLVVGKTIARTDLKLTLGHVTTSQELAKIDPDTGLQQDQGPGRLRFLTVAVRHNFPQASLLVTYSKADARDLDSGQPTPEAPRTLFDLLGTIQRLPLNLEARAEFEYVGRKPLGTGCLPDPNAQCTGTSVRELRAAVVRPFLDGRLTAGVNLLIAAGYTGQTTENFADSQILEVVGVRIPNYASLNLTYRLTR